MKKFVTFLFLLVCTMDTWNFKNLAQQLPDRLIAGQIMSNKNLQRYIEAIPAYNNFFSEYYDECGWGIYIKVQKNNENYGGGTKTPIAGLVFTF